MKFIASCLAVCGALLAASPASAATLLNGLGGRLGYGTHELPPNDDQSTPAIDLTASFPSGLNIYGTFHHSTYLNNNASLTFGGALGNYGPLVFPTTSSVPMIALWYGDADTTGAPAPADMGVFWELRPGEFVGTWSSVGYWSAHVDRLNSLQMILRNRSVRAPGDFDVEFRYVRCEWTFGDGGGPPANVGFDGADGVHSFELPGSHTAAILNLCSTSNAGMPGVWQFQFRNGVPTVCGNHVVESTETCDDGNLVAGDGCSPECTVETSAGVRCDNNNPCVSGQCVDGLCCDSLCAGTCEACDVPGRLGLCSPVVGNPHGVRAACAGSGPCASVCDGIQRATCSFPGADHSCGSGSCTSGVATPAPHCDGAGTCVTSAEVACAPFACGANACQTTCTQPTECANGFVCVAGSCGSTMGDAGALTNLRSGPSFRGSGCSCSIARRSEETRFAGLACAVVALAAARRRRERSGP